MVLDYTARKFHPMGKAIEIADANNKGDGDWYYSAVLVSVCPDIGIVEVYDENNELVGCL